MQWRGVNRRVLQCSASFGSKNVSDNWGSLEIDVLFQALCFHLTFPSKQVEAFLVPPSMTGPARGTRGNWGARLWLVAQQDTGNTGKAIDHTAWLLGWTIAVAATGTHSCSCLGIFSHNYADRPVTDLCQSHTQEKDKHTGSENLLHMHQYKEDGSLGKKNPPPTKG